MSLGFFTVPVRTSNLHLACFSPFVSSVFHDSFFLTLPVHFVCASKLSCFSLLQIELKTFQLGIVMILIYIKVASLNSELSFPQS